MSGEARASFTLINRLGLHARAATRLAQEAERFDAHVLIEKDGETARASSVLELLMLCGQVGTRISVIASGPQAQEAVAAIGDLVANRFGEPD